MTTEAYPQPPAVSVITVFLNEERFLPETITALTDQTFRDFELILVDDGSTDASANFAQRHAADNPGTVRYLAHPDRSSRGISASRNRGLAAARGEFVAFLDADDSWAAEKLAEQVDLLRGNPALGMVYGRGLIWHSWNADDPGADYYFELGLPTDCALPAFEPLRVLLENRAQNPMVSGALLRRSIISELGGFDDRFQSMFEDKVLFAKVLAHSPVYVSSRTWLRYRQHDQSLCARVGAVREAREHLRFVNWMRRYLRKEGIKDRGVWAALDEQSKGAYRSLARRSIKSLLTAR